MTKKLILKITRCFECPYSRYPSNYCHKYNKTIWDYDVTPPDWCKLENWDDINTTDKKQK